MIPLRNVPTEIVVMKLEWTTGRTTHCHKALIKGFVPANNLKSITEAYILKITQIIHFFSGSEGD